VIPPDAGRHVTWVDEGVGVIDGGPEGAAGLLIDDGDVLLVDAGIPEAAARDLARHVSLLVLTHAHPAHVRQARAFGRVWAPRMEAAGFRDVDGLLETLGVARQDRPVVRQWLDQSGWASPRVDKYYHAGAVFILPKTEWRALHLPGHSPGLCAFFEPKRRILFAPDLGGGPGAPMYNWPSADLDELENSLARLADLDIELLLTSHAPPRRRGAKQAFRDLAAAIRQRDAAYYEALETPRSVTELVDLGRIQGEAVHKETMTRYFERVMVEKHLSRLLGRGLGFARQDGKYQQA
jgi:glyoxylase-like metal-dependent hydrolase (beta-lactamase superfamily II)